MPSKKTIIISAVNIVEGGPLTVLRECLYAAVDLLAEEYNVVALVNSSDLLDISGINFLAIPGAKKSWAKRLYWEWFGFRQICTKLRPVFWLSLHDITPRITGCPQAVYCHNPSPFYKSTLEEAYLSPAFYAFSCFYYSLYSFFIRRNKWVIVQQDWLRSEFLSRTPGLPIVLSYPSVSCSTTSALIKSASRQSIKFLYPALPRVFKNIQTLCLAAQALVDAGTFEFEIILTITGHENKYSRHIYSRFNHLRPIKFLGPQTREQMTALYSNCDVLVFPSKLETWGLPITEAKAFSMPLFVSDLPYARETVGDYANVSFFSPLSSTLLASLMTAYINKSWLPSGNKSNILPAPFAHGWASLWSFLVTSSSISGHEDSSFV